MDNTANKIVNVKIIRHAHSIANEYKNKYGKHATEEDYRDAKLSNQGIESIQQIKDKLKEFIGNPDVIIVSPLKRAIQTCLLIFDEPVDKPIRIVPLVSELNNLIENKGSRRETLQNDKDLQQLLNFQHVDLSLKYDLMSQFYYYYGWKALFLNGWKSNNDKINVISDLKTWKDLNSDILSVPSKRITAFKNFLSDDEFSGKNIVIVSHCIFIKRLLGECPKNLGVASFTFDQIDQTIKNIQFMDFTQNAQISQTINIKGGKLNNTSKYINYKKYKNKYSQLKNK